MKTAQEVLADDAILRLRHEEEERELARLISKCRPLGGSIRFIAQLVASVALIVFFVSISRTGGYRGAFVIAGVFLFYCVPSYVLYVRGREKALISLLQREAPSTYHRLRVEHIA